MCMHSRKEGQVHLDSYTQRDTGIYLHMNLIMTFEKYVFAKKYVSRSVLIN